VACLLVLSATWRAADPTTTLWFGKPATSFYESVPLGNGRIGTMVFGGVDEERIAAKEAQAVKVRVNGEVKTVNAKWVR